jgi:hypothetical protein
MRWGSLDTNTKQRLILHWAGSPAYSRRFWKPVTKGGKAMHIVGPRSHKATKAKRLRGNMWKDIKRISWNNIRELGHYSGGR